MDNKLDFLCELIRSKQLDAIAMIPSPNFNWLTGCEKHLMERPMTLIVTADKRVGLIAAGFEMHALQAAIPFSFDPFPFDDNPAFWGSAFSAAGIKLGLNGKKIGVESIHFRYQETQMCQNEIQGCKLVAADSLFRKLRLNKTKEETALMKKAAEIAESALTETLKIVKIGMTENEIYQELVIQLLRNGSQAKFPFTPIVASGPNSADPHAEVSSRILTDGDFLLFDWGARYKGYCSDITRTFGVGAISEKQREVYNTVLNANLAGIQASKPGVRCGDIDKAARDVIQKAGYGPFFTHRVGHGLGMESHEDPYMFGENDEILETGMSFTVEPGIYLTNEFGVRIEDDATITADGVLTTTTFSKELRVL